MWWSKLIIKNFSLTLFLMKRPRGQRSSLDLPERRLQHEEVRVCRDDHRPEGLCGEKWPETDKTKILGKVFFESKDLVFRRRLQFGPNRWLPSSSFIILKWNLFFAVWWPNIYVKLSFSYSLYPQYANFQGQLLLVLCRIRHKFSKYCNTCTRIYLILIGKEMNECYSTSILNVFSTEVG